MLMTLNETITDYFKNPEFLSKFDFRKRKEEIKYNDSLDVGRLEEKLENVKKMLESDFKTSVIEKITGLSPEEIKKVQCPM